MKYISEERLMELLAQYKAVAELNCNPIHFDGMLDMLEMVIDECKELNQWQPIETSPKDRRILLLYEDGDVRIDWWHHESQQDNKIVAWIEIPEPPK